MRPRAALLLATLVACRGSRPAPPSGPPAPVVTADPLALDHPDVTTIAATPVECGSLIPETPACAGSVIATTPNELVTQVTELSCHPPGAHIGATHVLAFRTDRTLLASVDRSRCETLPLDPEPHALAERSDGRVLLWGRDPSGAKHLAERTRDGTWRISPAVDPRLATELHEHNGRVVATYRADDELGYYDEATHQLRPIQRGPGAGSVQVVPGAVAGEPPTALYAIERTTVIAQPDPTTGYRTLSFELGSEQCPDGGEPRRGRSPSGSFVDRANPTLLRLAGGGLWVAHTETRGHCTYTLVDRGASAPVGRNDRFLLARQPPVPAHWKVSAVPDASTLVLRPVDHGALGDAKRVAIPARRYGYQGPWQFHPQVSPARIRITIGHLAIDLDPNKLPSAQALATPWIAKPVVRAATVAIVDVPPVNAPPLPALRSGGRVAPLTIASSTPPKTVELPVHPRPQCAVVTRTLSDPKLVDLQLSMKCGLSRGLALAAGNERVSFTQFSQGGGDPRVEIDATGNVTLHAIQGYTENRSKLRFESGAFVIGDRLPRGAPPAPAGWMIYDHDATSVFATHYERGNELLRGTVDRTTQPATWKWVPAFATRTPAKGSIFWPVILPHAGADPTVVYVADPRERADVYVRTSAGQTLPWPTWSVGASNSGYRVHELAALEAVKGRPPLVAAKIDSSIVVGTPETDTPSYTPRALVGIDTFPVLAPRGDACDEHRVQRDREEVYSPQLVVAKRGPVLAYLASRVTERARWTVVAPRCGWVVDRRDVANELVLSTLDVSTGLATELARIPVDFRPGTGFHGGNLLVTLANNYLHAVATSYGHTTYSRIKL